MSETVKMAAIVVRDIVVLQGMTANFTIIKAETAKAVEEAMRGSQLVFVATQKSNDNIPVRDNLYDIGTIAHIKQISKLPDKSVNITLDILKRGRIINILTDEVTEMEIEEIDDDEDFLERFEREAYLRNIRELFLDYCQYNPKVAKSLMHVIKDTDRLGVTVDQIGGNIPLPPSVKASLLQTLDVVERFEHLVKILKDEIEVAKIQAELKQHTNDKVTKIQKEYYLREQLSAIRKELGEEGADDETEYRKSLAKLEAPDYVKEKIEKEIVRLSTLNNNGSEASVERGYIETLLELPWDKAGEDSKDIVKAREILERDHYGLEKVKERILEFLAVRALNSKGDSPIICLVGPPGTGKTSIARSIAEALNKKYVRISLGGVHDEAEIRGHRRTYVGAMPGNIVGALKSAGVKNPLILLDEIDKASADHRGDTSSALLEVLDSEQNSHFKDHYVGIPVDLSEVMFIATANSASDIPRPLYDRMDVIEVSSYTATEKFHIAKDYLLKKQFDKNGLTSKVIAINDKAIQRIIEGYTREAGVRELERKIAEICRKAAKKILEENVKKVTVTSKNLEEFLGKEKYRLELKNKKDEIGIVRGLAWTPVGGTTLSIEVNVMPGKGAIDLTGQMGDVMKESAMAGISFIRSVSKKLDISPSFFQKHDIHIHIPEGAVPKDGPSAGISMATAVISAITGMPVSRNIAMTGEITLRGRVLAVGGLKEKILAAKTAQIKKVLVPEENVSDIEEIPDEIKEGMEIVFVSKMHDVLPHAFPKLQTR